MKTVVNHARLLNLALRTREVLERNVPGDVVECGVGGSALVLAKEILETNRHLWLYDTFVGLPEPRREDGPRAPRYVGCNALDPNDVLKSVRGLGFPFERLRIVAGNFSETFERSGPHPKKIALLHVDCDWYESVQLCLTRWYNRVSVGGIVILDDYGYWPGCRQAFYEFSTLWKVRPLLNRWDEAAWWVKGEGEE